MLMQHFRGIEKGGSIGIHSDAGTLEVVTPRKLFPMRIFIFSLEVCYAAKHVTLINQVNARSDSISAVILGDRR